jgi:hypothetical protein
VGVTSVFDDKRVMRSTGVDDLVDAVVGQSPVEGLTRLQPTTARSFRITAAYRFIGDGIRLLVR